MLSKGRSALRYLVRGSSRVINNEAAQLERNQKSLVAAEDGNQSVMAAFDDLSSDDFARHRASLVEIARMRRLPKASWDERKRFRPTLLALLVMSCLVVSFVGSMHAGTLLERRIGNASSKSCSKRRSLPPSEVYTD